MPRVPNGVPVVATNEPGTVAQLASQFETSPDSVVADVNGTPITAGMVADHMRDLSPNLAAMSATMLYERSVDDLVQQRSLAVKARELGLDKQSAVKRRMDEATDHALANALIRQLLPELVTEKVVQDRYNTSIAGKPGPVEVQLRVIVTPDEEAANLALAAIRKGADFGDVARESSIDPTRALGGEVGFTSREKLLPEVGAVAYALMPGQMSQFPVLGGGKWFVIQVEGRRQRTTPTLNDARAELMAQLIREASVEVIKKTRAAVVVNDYGPTGMRKASVPAR
jgi:peptidyl-prolyl cis-trans isomerase C